MTATTHATLSIPLSCTLSPGERTVHAVLALVCGLGAGMIAHALAVYCEGRSIPGAKSSLAQYPYRAVLGLDWLIGSPGEALGWGAALTTTALLLLLVRPRHSSRPACE